MKAILIVGITLAGYGFTFGDEVPNEADKFQLMNIEERRLMVESLSPEGRQSLSLQLKARAKTADYPDDYDIARLQVSDEEVVSNLTHMFVNGSDDEALRVIGTIALSEDPKVLVLIGPALLHEDDLTSPGSRFIRSEAAALIIADMIPKIASLPEDVRVWGESLKSSLSYFEILVLREWWKRNGERMTKGDYKSVRPGALAPPSDAVKVSWGEDGRLAFQFEPQFQHWSPVPTEPSGKLEVESGPQAPRLSVPPAQVATPVRPSDGSGTTSPKAEEATETRPGVKHMGWVVLGLAALGLCIWVGLRSRRMRK